MRCMDQRLLRPVVPSSHRRVVASSVVVAAAAAAVLNAVPSDVGALCDEAPKCRRNFMSDFIEGSSTFNMSLDAWTTFLLSFLPRTMMYVGVTMKCLGNVTA